jgi:autotransporter-associated beta strand protein
MEDRTLLATMVWTNPAGGDWDTAGNWVNQTNAADHHIPTGSDDALINLGGITVTHASSASDSVHGLTISTSQTTLNLSSGTMSLAAASTISGDLTIAGGTLTGAGALTVDGPLTWTGGTISGSGAINAQGGLTLGGTAANTSYYEYLSGRILNNAGTATLFSSNAGGGLYLSNGATLDNRPGASFAFATDAASAAMAARPPAAP